jgi:hypothetical protein
LDAAQKSVLNIAITRHGVRGTAIAAGPWAALAAIASLTLAAFASPPTPTEIINRVLSANAGTPDVVSADVVFDFRLRKPVTDPPDCEFEGTLHFESGRQIVEIGKHTMGLTCWLVNKYVLGRLFEGTEPVQGFLSRFDFEVLGEKEVGTDRYYLMKGKARDPRTNPRGLIGWVDYDRGLVTDGAVEYSWGRMETVQRYAQLAGAWVLIYQYLFTARFAASMEVFYNNFQFAPR